MDKKNKYAEVLLNAYQDGVFKIVWGTSGFSIVIDSERKGMLSEIEEDEFVKYATSIVRLVIDMAEGEEIDKRYKEDLEIAQVIFNQEYDIKNHLYIRRNSKIDCYKLLEYEIISHRNKENPAKIEATSALVKMLIESGDSESSFTFEASRRDLDDIIDKLADIRQKMDML